MRQVNESAPFGSRFPINANNVISNDNSCKGLLKNKIFDPIRHEHVETTANFKVKLTIDIKESLTCRHCKTDLKDRKYLDFLEYLMANGIIEDLDFFDQKVYSEDVERLEPDDEEDVDPNDFEKKRDIFSLYETEMEI